MKSLSARKFLNKFLRFGKKIKKSFAIAVQIYQEIAREKELRKAQEQERFRRYRQLYAKQVKVMDPEKLRRDSEDDMLAILC